MLHLYDIDHNKIKGLKKIKDYHIKSVLSTGDKTLYFSYPSHLGKDIVEEFYIRNKNDEFIIKEIIENNSSDWIDVTATLNVEELEGKSWESFETVEQTIEDALNLAFAGTGWKVSNSEVTKKRTLRFTNVSAWTILQKAIKTYRVEIKIDSINKTISIYETIGSDKGCYFIDSLNLKSLTSQKDSYNFYTKMIAIGGTVTDADGNKTTLTTTVENYQYSNKVKTLIWKDERYKVLENLKEDAAYKLYEISKPYRSYTADIFDLANMNDLYKDILSYGIGDTITIISKEKRFKDKQRIVTLVEYPDDPRLNTVELSNVKVSFEQIQQEQQEALTTINNITSDNGTISDSALNGSIADIIKELISSGDLDINLDELNAVKIQVGKLEATIAEINTAYIDKAYIDELLVKYAKVEDLEAATGKIGILEADFATINELVAGNITAENLNADFLKALQGWILEGSIGDAQISNLNANKITAGTIDTSKVQVIGPNGRLKLSGNKIQIFDINSTSGQLYERLFMGIDETNNAMFLVRGSDGETVYIDVNGLTKAGFTDGYNKVEDGTLDAAKFDFKTIVTGINNGTTTINATSITIENMSLDAYFRQYQQAQTETLSGITTTLREHGSSIQANENAIKLKVDSQTYTSDQEKINQSLNDQESRIDILEDGVKLAVTSTEMNKFVTDSLKYQTNLLPNSTWNLGINNGWYGNNSFTLKEAEIDKPKSNILNIVKTGATSSLNNKKISKNVYIAPGNYTISFDVKITTTPDVDNIILYCMVYSTDTNSTNISDASYVTKVYIPDDIELGKWTRISQTFNISENDGNYLKVCPSLTRNGDISWREILLKKGSIDCDWVPYYADDSSYISTVNDSLNEYKNEVADKFTNYDDKLEAILDDVSGVIADGIIDDAEAITLKQTQQELMSTKTDIYSEVKYLRNKSVLPIDNKNKLNTAYSKFLRYHNKLIHTISDIINKGINYAQMLDDSLSMTGTNTTNQCSSIANINADDVRGKTFNLSCNWVVSGEIQSGDFWFQTSPDKFYRISDTVTVSNTNFKGTTTKTFTLPVDDGVTSIYNSIAVRLENFQGTIKFTNLRITLANAITGEDIIEGLRIEFEEYYNSYRDALDLLRTVINECIDEIATQTATKITSSEIKTLKASLDVTLDGIQGSVSSVTDKTTTLEGKYDTLNSSMTGVKDDIAIYKENVANDFADVRKSVSDLTIDINGAIKDGWIDEAESITLNRLLEQLEKEYTETVGRTNAILENDAIVNNPNVLNKMQTTFESYKSSYINYTAYLSSLINKGNVTDSDRNKLTTYQNSFNSATTLLAKLIDSNLNVISYAATVSEVNTAKTEIKATTDSITNSVSSLNNTVNKINGEVTSQSTALKEVQTKLTDEAFTVEVLKRLNTVFRVRYIRDTLSSYTTSTGSTSNYKYWYDISVYNNLGKNIALGLTPTVNNGTLTNAANVCDGSLTTYASCSYTGNVSLTLDLGAVYENLDRIRILHRTNSIYNFVKTEYSEDGEKWYTLYDSTVSGKYNELTYGHTYNLNGTGVSNTKVTVNETGLGVYRGAITVYNNKDTAVLQADSSGNLSITGTFNSYATSSGYKAVGMSGSNVYIYNWGKDGSVVGSISSNALIEDGVSNNEKPAMSLNHQKTAAASVGYLVSGSTYKTYVTFDKYNIRNTQAPIVMHENVDFNGRLDMHGGSMYLWNNYRIHPSNGWEGYYAYGTVNSYGTHWFYGDIYTTNNLNVKGSKNRIVTVDNGDMVTMGAYETATPYFGDIGEGETDENGICYVYLDDIYKQTVYDGNYQVFISKYGRGDVWVEERTKDYFIVQSEKPNIKFAWEVKSKQKGYENDRMEYAGKTTELTNQEEYQVSDKTITENNVSEDESYLDIYDSIVENQETEVITLLEEIINEEE